jgi:NAD(P)-dependent dehydrogenase (short-subunit alcohol dehydrogenase family)
MIRLDGQGAVVTGAGSGIGHVTAKLLAERGARVLVNDPAGDGRAEKVCAEIRDAGGEAVPDLTPVGTCAAANAIVDHTLAALGRLDVLVNNAGVARPGAFDAVADEDIDRVMAINLMGPYALMRAAWAPMRAAGYGRIVNLCSSAALGSGVSGAYAVSKAGIIGLTKDAALCGEPLGVRVNALMPSAHTPLIDNHPDPAFRAWMRTALPPEPVAAAVVYLASDAVPFSGEILTAGGGLVTRLGFLESTGRCDMALTPEAVRDHADEIMDFTNATPLSTQSDHQAIYDRWFPGRPGA